VLWPDLDVQLATITEQWAQYAIAGPRSRELLEGLLGEALDVASAAFPYLACAEFVWKGRPTRLFRVSFSGEMAYELAVPASLGDVAIRAIMTAGEALGIVPYGTEALGVMRIEKGHVAGNELNGTTTAADLGLGKLMAKKKNHIGRVLAERPGLSAPDRPVLVGVKPLDRSKRLNAGAHFLSAGAAATLENDQGFISSATFSPTLGHWIALGFLTNGASRHGERIRAHDPIRASADIEVEVTDPVFFDPEGLRLTDSALSGPATSATKTGGSKAPGDTRDDLKPDSWSVSPRTSSSHATSVDTRGAPPMDTTAGVHMTRHANLGIATLTVRKNTRAALLERFRMHFEIELPQSPRRIGRQYLAAIGLAPDAWLLTREQTSSHSWLTSLKASLGSSASICDQTDAYAVLSLTGPKLHQTLAKLIPIDLHPRSFRPGDAVQTLAHQISVMVWRLEDVNGHPAFELAVWASYFPSLHEALCRSAAEFGPIDR
jgi:heterotetrameric sarcosine oxidase gamma subunit